VHGLDGIFLARRADFMSDGSALIILTDNCFFSFLFLSALFSRRPIYSMRFFFSLPSLVVCRSSTTHPPTGLYTKLIIAVSLFFFIYDGHDGLSLYPFLCCIFLACLCVFLFFSLIASLSLSLLYNAPLPFFYDLVFYFFF
jgi:hypothetical protein